MSIAHAQPTLTDEHLAAFVHQMADALPDGVALLTPSEAELSRLAAVAPGARVVRALVPPESAPEGALSGATCGLFVREVGAAWSVETVGRCPSPVVLAPPPPAPAPAPPPQEPFRAPWEGAETMWRIAQIEASAPQDDVALAQSALLGFGAGHFYAGNRTRGLTHARVQGAGVFLTLVGAMLAAIGEEDGVIAGGTTLVAIGSGGLAVSRLVDLITAPYSARDARERAMIHDPPRELSSAPASSSGPASSATAERPVPLKVRPPGSPLPQPGLCIYRPGIGPETTFVVGDARLVVGANQFACAPMSEGPVVVIIEGRRNSWEGYVPSSETLYLQMLAGGLLRSDEVAFQRAVLAGMQDVSPE